MTTLSMVFSDLEILGPHLSAPTADASAPTSRVVWPGQHRNFRGSSKSSRTHQHFFRLSTLEQHTMPVRIRLAYHPLARKKEPLYHIVVAKSKSLCLMFRELTSRTGRQRKPLEVIGVYDPIPRYPTTPNGQVLEDRDKVKKISMNVDRVKYWLSVGAQPTNHCARLFAKVPLEPPP